MNKGGYTLHHAVSADGTRIGYRRLGRGPGLVLVHGAFVSGHEFEKLAAVLADAFTVYNLDRRGRRYSGPQGDRYGMDRECEDVLAVLRATGSSLLFGHSYGGLIALELARTNPGAVARLAVYEPAVSVRGSFPSGWMPGYKRAMAEGRELRAFVRFLKGVGTSQPICRLPAWLLELLLLPTLYFWEGRKLRDKLPTLIGEMEETFRLDSTCGGYAAIRAETLVMAGGRSPDFMLTGARAAADAIPDARLHVLGGRGHNAPELLGQRAIAGRLKTFFGAQAAEPPR
ncbi:alpha/beta hydrolase [Paenibacillus sp. MWE-103]|uniref:Alpha/beta hydrolase n=1 Tax=Paenibacillus artemisiicola TaxID=1172618 RepID=A0ABS3WKC1_9BACL|nr:alpha/beta hydrolase [Paenibacillus artemisiicola]MBO7748585.1 alpha/beta hydrolase [Paenibacillus artemisiicola]